MQELMPQQQAQPGRVRRTVNDLVMAEMFLVQATLESAMAIGDGLQQLGQKINEGEDQWDAIAGVLQRTADEAVEPYSTRYRYFKQMIGADSEGG